MAIASALQRWGFDPYFQGQFETWRRDNTQIPAVPGRVVAWEHGIAEVVVPGSDGDGIRTCFCDLTGNLRRQVQHGTRDGDLATGDWVVVELTEPGATGEVSGRIVELLTRRSQFRRRMAGSELKAQTLATNVDKVLVVTSANNDFNARRLERYLVAVWDSGARPVVVLNKSDLTHDPDTFLTEIRSIAIGAETIAVSAQSGAGLEALAANLQPGETIALVGSSGVGKSSLLNRLVGREIAQTGDIDDMDKGRHTTTRRAMVLLPRGGVLIDNPGMREFGLVASESGLDATFADVVVLSANCRFHDCGHQGEPGCAVLEAIAIGTLDQQRLLSYLKLEREMAALRARSDPRLQSERKQGYKVRNRAHRSLKKLRKAR